MFLVLIAVRRLSAGLDRSREPRSSGPMWRCTVGIIDRAGGLDLVLESTRRAPSVGVLQPEFLLMGAEGADLF